MVRNLPHWNNYWNRKIHEIKTSLYNLDKFFMHSYTICHAIIVASWNKSGICLVRSEASCILHFLLPYSIGILTIGYFSFLTIFRAFYIKKNNNDYSEHSKAWQWRSDILNFFPKTVKPSDAVRLHECRPISELSSQQHKSRLNIFCEQFICSKNKWKYPLFRP